MTGIYTWIPFFFLTVCHLKIQVSVPLSLQYYGRQAHLPIEFNMKMKQGNEASETIDESEDGYDDNDDADDTLEKTALNLGTQAEIMIDIL